MGLPVKMSFKTLTGTLVGSALLLPVVLAATASPGSLRLTSQADGSKELSLWLVPSVQVASRGQTVNFDLMAEFDDSSRVLTQLQFRILGDVGAVVNNPDINYQDSLRGKAKVGSVSVRADGVGELSLWVDEMSVMTGYADLPTRTTGAKLVVKN